jgi:hypothetical protein
MGRVKAAADQRYKPLPSRCLPHKLHARKQQSRQQKQKILESVVVRASVAVTKFYAILCFNHRDTETQKKHLFCVSVVLWFCGSVVHENIFPPREETRKL